MTANDTRQMGIEFERRVQLMMPQKEFLDKLDTETIYSFLNLYQDKLVHELFSNLNRIQEQGGDVSRIDILLKNLITTQSLTKENGAGEFSNSESWIFPQDAPQIGLYIRSTSTVNQYYKKGQTNVTSSVVVNKFVPNADIEKYAESPNNNLRIMRTPIITTKGPKFLTIRDRYTNITSLTITYYRNPKYFTILGDTPQDCELPIDLFDDLVSGAIALYVQYIVGLNKQDKKEDKENQS